MQAMFKQIELEANALNKEKNHKIKFFDKSFARYTVEWKKTELVKCLETKS
jgi:hypothetical protein